MSHARSGFSLVEMVIVLVLAGIISTAAVTMFSTQNHLNAHMTALGESQENARSAVTLAATELRSASGGSIVSARGDVLVVRVPIIVGIVCASLHGHGSAVYFPLDGAPLDVQTGVDAFDVRSIFGDWSVDMEPRPSDRFSGGSRQPCIDAGTGSVGTDSDYATMRIGGAAVDVGSPVRLYREISYFFTTSTLDSSRRGFFRYAQGQAVELAQGFSAGTRFEYRLEGDTAWIATVPRNDLDRITAVRLLAEVVGEGASGSATGSATFALSREIQLRNSE